MCRHQCPSVGSRSDSDTDPPARARPQKRLDSAFSMLLARNSLTGSVAAFWRMMPRLGCCRLQQLRQFATPTIGTTPTESPGKAERPFFS